MKTNREHRVLSSTGALAVLRAARPVVDGSNLVFPSVRGRALSDATISKMVRELGIPAVTHGFRSSFRDWTAECSDAPREVCELALAHVNSERVEAAYRRTDLFERRRGLMEEWAAFPGRSRHAPVAVPREPPPGLSPAIPSEAVAPILAGITDTPPSDAPPAGSPQRCPTTHQRTAPASHRRGCATYCPVL